MKTEIFSVWSKLREKGEYIHYHSHDYYELVFYCNGSGSTHMGEELYHFGTETFMMIPPYLEHDETHEEEGKVICICFYSDVDFPPALHSCENGEMKTIAYEMLTEALEQPQQYNEMIEALLRMFLIKLVRNKQKKQASEKNNFRFMIHYLTDNYHEKISFKQFAEQLNISYDYFQHSFKQQTGLSPQQFLIQKRIEAAKELLRDSQLSCTEIAYHCGFSNSAQFSSIFKRETGVTPLQYRKV